MTDEELVKVFCNTITTQLRTLGAELYNDVGDRMKPGSAQEQRIVDNIARNIALFVVSRIDCQTPAATYCTCNPPPNEIIGRPHLPSCPESPAYLKDV